MKNETIIDKILHFFVHNGNLMTVSVMFLVHAVLLCIMWAAGVMPLVHFNILSVVIYLLCIVLCRIGQVIPIYISIILEVTVYVILSTYYIGLRCGTYCYLIAIVPVIIYLGCFIFKGAKRWIIVFLLLINFLTFAILYIHFDDIRPVYDVAPSIRLVHVLFSSFVMVFSTIFYNTIYIYASEGERISLENKNKKLSADAQEDALTNLLNRRGFLPMVEQALSEGASGHFCIAFCDIDNFKRINDSYGHDAGDEVLRHIAWLIRKEMHGCDICRWGGEEIIILMRDYDMAVAREKAEYLRKSIEMSPTVFFNKHIAATITLGLAENNENCHVPDDVIKVADERMYYGKQHGKNIVIYEDKE